MDVTGGSGAEKRIALRRSNSGMILDGVDQDW
jgi:hypothetical protein